MKRGDWVRVRAYGDEIIKRRVVEVDGDIVAICRDDEFEAALREGREPVSVGFHKSDIVDYQEATE